MRNLYTRADIVERGIPLSTLQRKVARGEWHRVVPGIFVEGVDPPSRFEYAAAVAKRSGGVASHTLAGALWNFDSVRLIPPFVTVPTTLRKAANVRLGDLAFADITECKGVICTSGTQTLLDLAAVMDDRTWEHALESALRDGHTTIAELCERLPAMGAARRKGVTRVRRVLALRPEGAPPTESLLETLMVQFDPDRSSPP
jgi:hypothetical protein